VAKKRSTSAATGLDARMETLRSVVGEINKEFKQSVASLAHDGLRGDVQGFVPTGLLMLDLMLHGGVPLGRMIEISGRPGMGKSTLAAHILANCQKMGGTAIVLDSENSWTTERVRDLGLDASALIQFEANTVEEGFSLINATLQKLEKLQTKGEEKPPVIIIWDTIAASPCERDIDPDKAGTAMDKPRAIHIGIKKIYNTLRDSRASLVFINQIITKMSSFGGPTDETPGGWGIKFGVSQQIRLGTVAQGKIVVAGELVGNIIRARITKNKIPGERAKDFEARIPLLFDGGFNDDIANLMFLAEGQTMSGSSSKKLGGDCEQLQKGKAGIYSAVYNEEELKFRVLGFPAVLDTHDGMREWLIEMVKERFLKPVKAVAKPYSEGP